MTNNMARLHYIAVAAIIAKIKDKDECYRIAEHLSREFSNTYDNFNGDKFMGFIKEHRSKRNAWR